MAVLNNLGRIIWEVPGITGVQSGGLALVNLPVNCRMHRFSFACTNGGAAVSPATLLSSAKVLVNGTNMRDITPASILAVSQTSGYNPNVGELPIFFTSPFRNMLVPNDSNSWDLWGQSTFSVQLGINAQIAGVATVPGITGVMEFDYLRNTRDDGKGGQVPFLQPMAHHQFLYPGVKGRNDITTLPIDFPISRLLVSSGAGNNISFLEVYQDGNKIVEGTPAELNRFYAQYGFLLGGGNPVETAAIFDVDQRWWKSLKSANSMILRVTLAAADTIGIIMETMPGGYAS